MVLIRADANERIGAGHVMRCLSVAHAFAKREIEVKFISADHQGDGLIQQKGFSCICLDSEWTDMDGEIDLIVILIKKMSPKLLLIDSYYVTDNYLSTLSEYVKTVYMDDLNTEKWNVDVLINYNIFSAVFDYATYEKFKTELLLGPKYAPLRDEFKNCQKHVIKKVEDILISAGGADPEQLTEKFIKDVCKNLPNIRFHFIVGALNPRLKEIKNLAKKRSNAILHINEQNISDLMKNCDVAISAAGTTLYELCACGIPTITYTMADNQLAAAEQFNNLGIMFNAGDCRRDDGLIEQLEGLLDKIINDDKLRKKLSSRMQKLVDGNGAERIVDALL